VDVVDETELGKSELEVQVRLGVGVLVKEESGSTSLYSQLVVGCKDIDHGSRSKTWQVFNIVADARGGLPDATLDLDS
jgi:hypothetical protein